MSIGGISCKRGDRHRRRKKPSEKFESPNPIGHIPKGRGSSRTSGSLDLPEPTDDAGMGDILRGVMSDPESDPVEEVRDIRRNL